MYCVRWIDGYLPPGHYSLNKAKNLDKFTIFTYSVWMFTLLFNNIYKNKNRDIQLDYAWIVFVYTNIYDFYYNFFVCFACNC